jgi:mannose-6-phosphate isomerase-like protein (cupin superfamily)
MPAPAAGQTWNLERIRRSGAAFETLIGTYLEGSARAVAAPPPDLPSLSLHYWHLSPGDVDTQQPHREDELYYVLAGSGTLIVAGERRPLTAGDVIFVPRGAPHQFVDMAEPDGLDLLIFFAPNYTGRGGAPARTGSPRR